ncbi:hypothetical protein [Devosia sp. SL43]|uniref:hypothetical protein n=1 Tax=Devosia sp. SL43 TaxID=2806348 RepID=UPI001F2B50B5|nr:hypothetical protein [Devosia sp. SL43]UJW87916.1 hypothetical protein IM737_20760 [Devosia sp. SL43]
MSSLAEMKGLVHQAADFTSPSDNWKDRVQAAARALGFGWSRTKDLYYQDARRIDAEEMDHARKIVGKLKQDRQRREAAEHVAWLRRTVQSLRADGRQLDGDSLDVLERLAGVVGAEGSALVAMAPEVAAEDFDQSQGWGA